MGSNLLGNEFCLGERELFNGTPFGAARVQGSCDVEVNVPDRLACGLTVVLPDGDTWTLVSGIDSRRCVPYLDHQRRTLIICQVENGLSVPGRDDEKVRFPTLFLRNHNRCQRVPCYEGERSTSFEVGAERARLRVRKPNS